MKIQLFKNCGIRTKAEFGENFIQINEQCKVKSISFYIRKLEKKEWTHSKLSRRKERIKTRAEITEIKKRINGEIKEGQS
jgi:type IV secretory pathway ATPase VirB11/archaellum biosynthesis ATPase